MTNDQISDKVRRWLNEDGYQVGTVTVQGGEQPDWSVAINYSPSNLPEQPKVNLVVFGRTKRQRVEIILKAVLAPEHAKAMNSNSMFAQAASKKIRSSLFIEGIGLSFLPGPQGKISEILFDDVIYYDAPITKDRFMSGCRRLYAVLLFASDVMSEAAKPGSQGLEVDV